MGDKVAHDFYTSGVELLPQLAKKLSLIDNIFYDYQDQDEETLDRLAKFEILARVRRAENWVPSREESEREIEAFLKKVKPAAGEIVSPAVAVIEKFLNKK